MTYKPPKLQRYDSGWAIIHTETGNLATEMHRNSTAISKLNTDKFHAIPISQYIDSLNEEPEHEDSD